MGGKKKQIVGWRHKVSAHAALCLTSPKMELRRVLFDKRIAWEGTVLNSQEITIDAPDLFGGDEREGGVSGAVDVMFGEATQGRNSHLVESLGPETPGYRGLFSLVFKSFNMGNNPYIKQPAFELRSTYDTWHPELAEIGEYGHNPAHIVRELFTNREFGMGFSVSAIDDASFLEVAQTLYNENFGLVFFWVQQNSTEEFMQQVIDHVAGGVRENPQTGLFEMYLVRGGYDLATIKTLDAGAIKEIEDYGRPGPGETPNEITLIYKDRALDKDVPVTVHNMASIQSQGGIISKTRRFPGIPEPDLAQRVAQRELDQLSVPISRVRVSMNRSGWDIRPGDLFRLTWPPHGIDDVVYRVGRVTLGTLERGTVTFEAAEDVYGLPSASYVRVQPSGWTDPVQPPQAIAVRKVYEAPYWEVAQAVGDTEAQALDPAAGFVVAAAGKSGTAYAFTPQARVGADEFEAGEVMDYAIIGALDVDVDETATTLAVKNLTSFDASESPVGGYAMLNDEELVEIITLDTVAGTMTVKRGILDTVPSKHLADSEVWFLSNFLAGHETEFAHGDIVDVKLLSQTGKGTLLLSSAPTDVVVMNSRQARPYPPGNVRLNGAALPASTDGSADLVIAWAHRDRLLQTGVFVGHTEGDIGPEVGTTYTVTIIDENTSTQLREETGITGNTFTYTKAQECADAGLGGGGAGTPVSRYFRWRITQSTNGSSTWITQFELYGAVGGANLLLPGTDTMDTTHNISSGRVPGRAIDGNPGDWWISADVFPRDFKVDLGAGNEIAVAEYGINGRLSAPIMTDWTFEYSNNGTDWTVADTRAGEDMDPANVLRKFEVTGGAPAGERTDTMRIQLKSVRDGLDSWQSYDHVFDRSGDLSC